MKHHLITSQQHCYEQAYLGADNEYGFLDRKITDGQQIRGARILNLGCGTANDVWWLAGENEIIGLDYAQSGLRVAQRHGVVGVVVDLNLSPRLPFRDGAFDIVICKDILEHILEPLIVLQEVRRVLKDDGYVIISVPNHFYLPMRVRILLGKGLIWKSIGSDHSQHYDEWNYMHIRFFTYQGFHRFLRAAGFRPEKWYWDLGTLAHYNNPDMWLEPQLWKMAHGKPISRRGKLGLYVIRPLWKVFNFIFPYQLRRQIVAISPGLLCAGFYVKVRKI
ncbi:MAG: class I SAM-dependent methyltransferase [Thermoflexales bacterium]|nr:class I SAM-dependent methyltransferase [Thermoflexales bacterium]